ncbi:response regulator transcription factor [Agriterribacter humi]|jgi:DNA-binding response OmpR family regulator|uniref:response regulator transcription factor n=1 Tax=Agriterribacter humi TaxID=1104781 RepID=UPI001264C02A|nr:response regulator transcription factor [Agriterribacter humi]
MKKTKILYVEDETFLAKIVKESLESRGYEVLLEMDGADVMTRFHEIKPDICILDIMLPNKDGFAIAEEIRQADIAMPIIFLTAKTQTIDLVKGFHKGANDYIRKPFSMEELIVRVENALRYRNGEEQNQGQKDEIRMGKYIFNPHRQTLTYNAEEKKLSFRESELLKLLHENRQHVIDRRDILNVLWGSDSFFNSRTLDVYITKIRGYLKSDPALEIITVKGVGYRFVME